MYNRLLGHLNECNILSKHRFTFRTNSRTDNAIFKPISEINSLNHGLLVGRILCDLQKAFDCVSHRILLSDLKNYGITGNIMSFIDPHWMADIREHQYLA
jgi:hypothetical protein